MGERQIHLRILYLCLIPVAIWELRKKACGVLTPFRLSIILYPLKFQIL